MWHDFQDDPVGQWQRTRRSHGKSRLSQRQEGKSVAGAEEMCAALTIDRNDFSAISTVRRLFISLLIFIGGKPT